MLKIKYLYLLLVIMGDFLVSEVCGDIVNFKRLALFLVKDLYQDHLDICQYNL